MADGETGEALEMQSDRIAELEASLQASTLALDRLALECGQLDPKWERPEWLHAALHGTGTEKTNLLIKALSNAEEALSVLAKIPVPGDSHANRLVADIRFGDSRITAESVFLAREALEGIKALRG